MLVASGAGNTGRQGKRASTERFVKSQPNAGDRLKAEVGRKTVVADIELTSGHRETTTVKVATSTRDHVREYGARTSLTADEVIQAGLAALEREELRRTARAQALALAHDEDDLAEMRAVREDLNEARAR